MGEVIKVHTFSKGQQGYTTGGMSIKLNKQDPVSTEEVVVAPEIAIEVLDKGASIGDQVIKPVEEIK